MSSNSVYCYAVDPTTCDGVRPNDDNAQHQGWHHAESWNEIRDALAAGINVVDPDGDKLVEVVEVEVSGDRGSFHISWDDSLYHRFFSQILIEGDPMPYSLEDEQEALRSIGAAYRNLRDN